jgi:hypothetical protein
VRPVPDPASHSRTLDTQTPPTTTFARAPPAPPAHPTISLTMADDSTSKKSKTVVGSQVGSGDHDEWLRRVQGAYVSSHTLHTHTHTRTHTHTHPLPVADRPYHAVRTSFATHALMHDVCVVAGMVPCSVSLPSSHTNSNRQTLARRNTNCVHTSSCEQVLITDTRDGRECATQCRAHLTRSGGAHARVESHG